MQVVLKAIGDATVGQYTPPGAWRSTAWRNGSNQYFCTLCDKGPMPFSQWSAHVNSLSHQSNLRQYETHFLRIKREQKQIRGLEHLYHLQA